MADVDMKKYQDEEKQKRADAYKAAEVKAAQSKKMREAEDKIYEDLEATKKAKQEEREQEYMFALAK